MTHVYSSVGIYIMDKNLVFTVQFDIKPECVHTFEKSLLNVLNRMSVEDTFISCYLDKDSNDDARYILYEIWKEPSVESFSKNQSNELPRRKQRGINYGRTNSIVASDGVLNPSLRNKDYRKEFNSKIEEWIKKDKVVTILEPVQEWHK